MRATWNDSPQKTTPPPSVFFFGGSVCKSKLRNPCIFCLFIRVSLSWHFMKCSWGCAPAGTGACFIRSGRGGRVFEGFWSVCRPRSAGHPATFVFYRTWCPQIIYFFPPFILHLLYKMIYIRFFSCSSCPPSPFRLRTSRRPKKKRHNKAKKTAGGLAFANLTRQRHAQATQVNTPAEKSAGVGVVVSSVYCCVYLLFYYLFVCGFCYQLFMLFLGLAIFAK